MPFVEVIAMLLCVRAYLCRYLKVYVRNDFVFKTVDFSVTHKSEDLILKNKNATSHTFCENFKVHSQEN